MYIPPIDQEAINQRASDIEDLKKQHAQFRKLMEIKIAMLENRNAKREDEIAELSAKLKFLIQEHEKTKNHVADLAVVTGSHTESINDLSHHFNVFSNQRVDVAGKIEAARKRLDETGKS